MNFANTCLRCLLPESFHYIILLMKYAVVKIGGSQYRVAEGEEIEVEKIEGEKGKKLTFEEVLLFVDGERVKIGRPFVKGMKVKAEILDQFKGKKIRVATYKAKSRYRRVKGHRKRLTKLKIEKLQPQKRKAPTAQARRRAKTRKTSAKSA